MEIPLRGADARQGVWTGPKQGEVVLPRRSRWSLQTKVAIMLVLLAALSAGEGWFVVGAQATISNAHERAAAQQSLGRQALALQVQVERQNADLQQFAATKDQSFADDFTIQGNGTARSIRGLQQTAASDRSASADLAQVVNAVQGWQAWAGRRKSALTSRTSIDSTDLAQGDVLFHAFGNAVLVLTQYTDRAAAEAVARANSEAANLNRFVLAATMAVLVAFLVLAAVFFGSTLRPISVLVEVAIDLASGRRRAIPWTARKDEVGQLAKALAAWNRSSEERLTLARQMLDVANSSDVAQVLDLCAVRVREELAATQTLVFLGVGGSWKLAGSEPRPYVGDGLAARSPEAEALRTRRSVVSDLRTGEWDPALRGWAATHNLAWVKVMPLVSGGQLLGTITAVRSANQPAFSGLDDELAEIVVPPIAAAIHVGLLTQALRQRAQTPVPVPKTPV